MHKRAEVRVGKGKNNNMRKVKIRDTLKMYKLKLQNAGSSRRAEGGRICKTALIFFLSVFTHSLFLSSNREKIILTLQMCLE